MNSFTKYPSILTLHQLGPKGILQHELTTPIQGETLYATEKIDGTNVRIICLGNEYLIGSREFILHYSGDLYFDPAQGIVAGIRQLQVPIPKTTHLTVIYGEFFGGKTSSNSKWYGQEVNGFRVFDIAVYDDLSVLDLTLPEISAWRERETPKGMIYGQHFLSVNEMRTQFPQFEFVPMVQFDPGDYTHATILDNLLLSVPESKASLTETATKKTEGVVLRTADRSKIVKVRFEDYERTLRKR